MTDRKPLFAECNKCGERWKIATLPTDCKHLGRLARRMFCWNCGEHREIGLCQTDGPHAVTEAREGKAP